MTGLQRVVERKKRRTDIGGGGAKSFHALERPSWLLPQVLRYLVASSGRSVLVHTYQIRFFISQAQVRVRANHTGLNWWLPHLQAWIDRPFAYGGVRTFECRVPLRLEQC